MAYPRSSRTRRARAVWAAVGVGVLAVVVVVLSVLALSQNRSIPGAGSTPGATAPGADVTPSPVETEVAAPATPAVVVPTRVMAAVDADVAVRAVATACPSPTTIETTDDAGSTWQQFAASDVAAVQRLSADADGFVSLIGLATEGCAPVYEQSFVGGEAWETAPDELAAAWFVDPANRAGVHSPAGDRQAPCAVVVQLAAIDESSAAVLCDDASVHATTDAGATWLPPASVPGAAALSVAADGYLVAAVDQSGCVGVQLVGLEVAPAGVAATSTGGCLGASVGVGEVAVATAPEGTTWLWASDALARSGDGGATWL